MRFCRIILLLIYLFSFDYYVLSQKIENKQKKRQEWFWNIRKWPNNKIPSIKHNSLLFNKLSKHDQLHEEYEWNSLGPSEPQGDCPSNFCGSGRINCICFHPKNPTDIWIGAASGGIWKSTDYGASWQVIENTDIMSIGISDIAISPSNPLIMYAVTGDCDAWESFRGYSVGLIKSTDGGSTWKTTNISYSLDNNMVMCRVVIHPDDPDMINITTNYGILKSKDGGSTWEESHNHLFFKDLEQFTAFPDILIASTYDVEGNTYLFRSSDFGDSWEQVYEYSGVSRSEVTSDPSNNSVLYVVSVDNSTSSFHNILKSEDAGITWSEIEISTENFDPIEAQGYYNLVIMVDRTSPSSIYCGGVKLWKSTNYGNTWEIAHKEVHVDHHELKQSPFTNEIFSANDGGIYKIVDTKLNIFKNLSDDLNITQFYKFGINTLMERNIFAGSQDNGVIELTDNNWRFAASGDGMECLIDYENHNIIYASIQKGLIFRSDDGGKTFKHTFQIPSEDEKRPWVTPFILDPENPKTLYIGLNNLWKTTDRGLTFNPVTDVMDSNNLTVNDIEVSTSNPDIIYFCNNLNLYKSTDKGISWDIIYTSNDCAISDILIDPDDPHSVWISLSGYVHSKKIIRIDSLQQNNISNNLPNIPVSTIEYCEKTDQLFVGTDAGVYLYNPDMQHWERFGSNLPNVIISELEMNKTSGTLVAATFGRGLWEVELYKCHVQKPEIKIFDVPEFCEGEHLKATIRNPMPGYRYYWSNATFGDTTYIYDSIELTATAIAPDGCISTSAKLYIKKLEKPDLRLVLLSQNPVCRGDSVIIKAEVDNYDNDEITYLWNNGHSEDIIKAYKSDSYYVTATANNGCRAVSNPYEVIINPIPEIPVIQRHDNLLIGPESTKYQWFLDGKPIENANGRTHYINSIGQYWLRVTNEFGCSNISVPYFVYFFNDNEFPVDISPNPAIDMLRVEVDILKKSDVELIIFDILGRIVKSYKEKSVEGYFSHDFYLHEIAAGAYYIQIKTNYHKRTVSFMKIW